MTIKISFLDNSHQARRKTRLNLGGSQIALPNVIVAPKTVEKLGVKLVQQVGLIAGIDTFELWQDEKRLDNNDQAFSKEQLVSSYQGSHLLMTTDPMHVAASYAKPRGIKKDIVRFRLDPEAKLQSLTPAEAVQMQTMISKSPTMVSLPTQRPDYFAPKDLIDAAGQRTAKWTEQVQSLVGKGNHLAVAAWQGAGLKRSRYAALNNLLQVLTPSAIAISGIFQDEPLDEAQRLLPELVNMLQDNVPNSLRITVAPASYQQLKLAFDSGVDLVTTSLPTDFAEQGLVLTMQGPRPIADYRQEGGPIDPHCPCPICQQYGANDVAHEISFKWPAGQLHLAIHNLYTLRRLTKFYRDSLI